jgi:hypothetical protein
MYPLVFAWSCKDVAFHLLVHSILSSFKKLVGTLPLPKDSAVYSVYTHLLKDLHRMQDFEKQYPLGIVAFGSARLSSDDWYYLLATRLGEILAKRGYLVRTGTGPGILDAVPVGWKKQMSRSSSSMSAEQTQGVSSDVL